MTRYIQYISCALLILSSTASCKKYLDAKPDEKLSTLNSVADMQAFLDDFATMNTSMQSVNDVLSDDYYLTTDAWNGLETPFKELYLWKKVNIPDYYVWNYRPVLYANIVLDEIKELPASVKQGNAYNNVYGSALFFRAFHHFSMAPLFAMPYNKSTAKTDLGLPLRLTSDYNVPSSRSNVEDTYAQIFADLKDAANFLPTLALIKTRPSKAAAYGTLARAYLSIQEYDSAGLYANKCMALYDSLLDFNIVTEDFEGPDAFAPIKRFNREIIFYARTQTSAALVPTVAKIDTLLYKSYDDNDLRKKVLFKENVDTEPGTYSFKGDYDGQGEGSGYSYCGIVTDEMYLIRAESFARNGKLEEAQADLMKLLQHRWDVNATLPTLSNSQAELIAFIQKERRRELIFRGLRWTDLRRRMMTSENTVIPKRIIDSQAYQLAPGTSSYTLWIPFSVISLTGMPQNP